MFIVIEITLGHSLHNVGMQLPRLVIGKKTPFGVVNGYHRNKAQL